MVYPKIFLEALGTMLLQIDFIGPRYLKGTIEPLHFLSCKYVRPFKKHIFLRIPSQTSHALLNAFFLLLYTLNLPLPDVMQMDNGTAFRGFIERKGCVGKVIKWLCANGAIPLFNAPNSPWNNGSVEGGNSVFDRKVWQAFQFTSLAEVDQKLSEFNRAYDTYLLCDAQSLAKEKPSIDPRTIKAREVKELKQPYLYLLRVVREFYGQCQVEALNRYFTLPPQYKGQYVIVQIDLREHNVRIWQDVKGVKTLLYASNIVLNLE
jgi:hypothetical protein